MKCPDCQHDVQEGWKACPACGARLSEKRPCPACGKELDSAWKVCPFCEGDGKAGGPSSTNISDSVVKELHQTQHTDARQAGGASIGGGVHFVVGGQSGGGGHSRKPEMEYEEYVLTILEAGGMLEQARVKLEEWRRRLGLPLRVAREVEAACMTIHTRRTTTADHATPIENGQPKIGVQPDDIAVKHSGPYFDVVVDRIGLLTLEADAETAKQEALGLATSLSPQQFNLLQKAADVVIGCGVNLDPDTLLSHSDGRALRITIELATQLTYEQLTLLEDVYAWACLRRNLGGLELRSDRAFLFARALAERIDGEDLEILKSSFHRSCIQEHGDDIRGAIAEALGILMIDT